MINKFNKLIIFIAAAALFSFAEAQVSDMAVPSNAKPPSPAQRSEKTRQQLIDSVCDIATVQSFTDEAVPQNDVNAILTAGINAQSAMNRQPWHFSVVSNKAILKRIADDMAAAMPVGRKPPAGVLPRAQVADAPLVVFVSVDKGSEYDAGLASQAICVAAVMLGYGTKIVSSPTAVLNGVKRDEYKKLLSVPEGKYFAAVILIGKENRTGKNTDGYTGATPRNAFNTVVSFIGKDQ